MTITARRMTATAIVAGLAILLSGCSLLHQDTGPTRNAAGQITASATVDVTDSGGRRLLPLRGQGLRNEAGDRRSVREIARLPRHPDRCGDSGADRQGRFAAEHHVRCLQEGIRHLRRHGQVGHRSRTAVPRLLRRQRQTRRRRKTPGSTSPASPTNPRSARPRADPRRRGGTRPSGGRRRSLRREKLSRGGSRISRRETVLPPQGGDHGTRYGAGASTRSAAGTTSMSIGRGPTRSPSA